MDEPVALAFAEVGAVPGSGDPSEGSLPVASNSVFLKSAEELRDAIHAGSAPWLDEPLGWREWLQWRADAGRRGPATPAMSQLEPQLWQEVMAELFGEAWRMRIQAFRP